MSQAQTIDQISSKWDWGPSVVGARRKSTKDSFQQQIFYDCRDAGLLLMGTNIMIVLRTEGWSGKESLHRKALILEVEKEICASNSSTWKWKRITAKGVGWKLPRIWSRNAANDFFSTQLVISSIEWALSQMLARESSTWADPFARPLSNALDFLSSVWSWPIY